MQGWKLKTLGEVAEVQSGGTPLRSHNEYWSGNISWYSSGELNETFTKASKDLITQKGLEESNAKLFLKGSLLIGMYDTAALKMSILDRDAAFNQAIAGVKPNENIDLKFILYAIDSRRFEILNQRRGVRQKNLSLAKIKNIALPVPPLPEQKRIVAIVDNAFEGIDRAIANTKKNLTNARELFESYLNATFTQRDSVPTVAISDIGEIFDGPHATPKTIDSGPIFLGISSLQDGAIKLEKTRHVSPEDFQKWTRRVKPRTDDIVFSYETRLGQAAIIPEGLECCLGRRMGLVRVDKTQIEPLYFLYLYISPTFQKFLNEKTIRGATVDRISIKEFPSFPIPLPNLEDQKSIVFQVDMLSTETQRLEAIYQQKLAALNELKQTILQKAFTGELTADTANQATKTAEGAIAA